MLSRYLTLFSSGAQQRGVTSVWAAGMAWLCLLVLTIPISVLFLLSIFLSPAAVVLWVFIVIPAAWFIQALWLRRSSRWAVAAAIYGLLLGTPWLGVGAPLAMLPTLIPAVLSAFAARALRREHRLARSSGAAI